MLCFDTVLNSSHLDGRQLFFAFVNVGQYNKLHGYPHCVLWPSNKKLYTHHTAFNHIHLIIYTKQLVLSVYGLWSTLAIPAGN